MKLLTLMLSVLAPLSFSQTSQATLKTHQTLEALFQNEKNRHANNQQASWTAEEKQTLSAYTYVFIDGMLGDLTKDLYKNLLPHLQTELPGAHIEVLRPSSFNGLEENAKWIAFELAQNIKNPKIVVAHSRGAAELFLALLMHPSLFEDASLGKVILVQGAMSGAPVAEWVVNLIEKWCPENNQSETSEVCHFAKAFSKSSESLIPQVAIELRAKYQKTLKASDKQKFTDKVYFVRSQSDFKSTSPRLKAGYAYLARYMNGFHNDGILLTSHQRVKGYGTDLGILQADHLSLLGTNAKSPKESIHFFRALVQRLMLD